MVDNGSCHVVPARSPDQVRGGTQGERGVAGPWTPAFAGVTDEAQWNSKRGLEQRE